MSEKKIRLFVVVVVVYYNNCANIFPDIWLIFDWFRFSLSPSLPLQCVYNIYVYLTQIIISINRLNIIRFFIFVLINKKKKLLSMNDITYWKQGNDFLNDTWWLLLIFFSLDYYWLILTMIINGDIIIIIMNIFHSIKHHYHHHNVNWM